MHCDFWQRGLFQTCQSFRIRSALKVRRVYRGVSSKSLTSSVFQRSIGSPTCSTPYGQDLPINGVEEGCISTTLPRGGMYWVVHLYSSEDQEISRGPRDVPRPKRCPEGHLKSQGKSRGPNLIDTDSRQCTANHSSLIHPLGCIRKYIPIPHPMCQIVLGLIKLILPCIVFSSH